MFLDRTGNAIGIGKVVINNEDVPFKVQVGDIYKYLNEVEVTKKKEGNLLMVQRNFLEKLVRQGLPQDKRLSKDDEDYISQFIELNFKEMVKAISIKCNLASEKDFEQAEIAKEVKN